MRKFFIKLEKPHFEPTSGPLLLLKLQWKSPPLSYCNFMQKKQKFHVLFFIKLEKLHFGPISDTFDPKTSKETFS